MSRRRWSGTLCLLTACHVSAPRRSASCEVPGCAPQHCTSDDAGCDAVVLEGVWIWNGHACVEAYASGCSAVGPDCDALYPTPDACESARAQCSSCR